MDLFLIDKNKKEIKYENVENLEINLDVVEFDVIKDKKKDHKKIPGIIGYRTEVK